MPRCAIKGCPHFKRRSGEDNVGIRCHLFPTNPEQRKIWVDWVNKINVVGHFAPGSQSGLCSAHFTGDSYLPSGRLRKDAAPSIAPLENVVHVPDGIASSSSISRAPAQCAEQSASEGVHISPIFPQDTQCQEMHQIPTTPVRKEKRKDFVGDLSPGDFSTPKRARKHLAFVNEYLQRSQQRAKLLHQSLRRAKKKIEDLSSLLTHLKESSRMTIIDTAKLIEENFPGPAAEILKNVMYKKAHKKVYTDSAEVCYDATFSFSSGLRLREKNFHELSHPRTIGKWFQVVDGKPGFTKESANAIRIQADALREKGHKLYLAVMCDEMAIRAQVQYLNDGTVTGYVDDGCGAPSDSSPLAKEAWVFMAVAVNGSWKIPVGYFFIASMGSQERSNIIRDCLLFLHSTGAVVVSLTFDGTATNIASVEALGAGMQPLHNWKNYFSHPETKEPIYVFLDSAHMLKLWRNVFGNPKAVISDGDQTISFKYIPKLCDLQEAEGLRAGNKLSKRHVQFEREKMKVFVAAQTPSASVADAIEACRVDYGLPEFEGSESTVKFIRIADNAFDILNSANLRAKKVLKKPLNPSNIDAVRAKVEEIQAYIFALKAKGVNEKCAHSILDSRWRTGFLGFLCGLNNINLLYDRLVATGLLQMLPIYKFSQDHLETFFSAIRSKGGWNNNPSTIAFTSAYKRLLVRVELKEKRGSNCWPLELVSVLHVSSKINKDPVDSSTITGVVAAELQWEHSYSRRKQDDIVLSNFVDDIVSYIAGFVVKKIAIASGCDECAQALFGATSSGLIHRKNRGGLRIPSADVVAICRRAEMEIRLMAKQEKLLRTKVDAHVIRIYRELIESCPSVFECLDEHILSQAPLENHKDSLIKLVIKKYVIIRVCYDVKKVIANEHKERIRSRNTKLVLFSHQ